MKKVILIITILFFISQSNSQGWIPQSSGAGFNLKSVYFVDVNTGYAVGDTLGAILKTINGGINWLKLPAPTSLGMNTVYFQNADTGFIGGGAGGSSCINKTTNGGLMWTLTFSNPIQYVYSIYFMNAATGIAVTGAYSTSGGYIFRSSNGGINWASNTTFGNALYSVYFTDANTGYICGTPGIVAKTTDAGLNWLQQSIPTVTNLRSIYFINSMTGWTAGTDSRVYKTTNGGANWLLFYNQSLCGLYSVRFVNEQTGWVCGCEGAINGTTNNGTNWILQSFASTTYLYAISFPSSTTGWAVGAGGRILKTTTGGITGINPVSNEIPAEFSLSQNYPNPFNPSTNITFALPKGSFVKVVIYDALGREVETIVNEQLTLGTYEINWNASNYPSGVYYYKLSSESYSETKKMILLK